MTRDERILSLAPLVGVVTSQFCRRLPWRIKKQEIKSAAWMGAIRAVDGFDESRGVLLKTFADRKMRGAIQDYLRSLDLMSRDERRKFNAQADDGAMVAPKVVSIDCLATRGAPSRGYADVENRLDVATLMRRAELKPREAEVIARRDLGEETMLTIGRTLGISEGRVSQIRAVAIEKMRRAA